MFSRSMNRTAPVPILPMLPEVKNSRWRPQTGSTYISASRQASIEIPTAKSMFSGSRNRMALVPILPDVNGSKKIQDGGRPLNRKYLYYSFRQDSIKIPMARPMLSGSKNRTALVPILPDVTGNKNSRWRPLNRKYLYLSF